MGNMNQFNKVIINICYKNNYNSNEQEIKIKEEEM